MARSARRAIEGSLALVLGTVVLTTAVGLIVQQTHPAEARDLVASAATSIEAPAAALTNATSAAPAELPPSLAVRPDPVELVEEFVEPSAPERTTRTSAVTEGAIAGPLPAQTLSVEERRAAFLEAVAARDNTPPVVEPPYTVIHTQKGSPPLSAGSVVETTISFYYCRQGETYASGDGGGFCGAMRDGSIVYDSAAACAFTYLGQKFRIVGDPTERVYTCADTGSAVHGMHRDIWFETAEDGWAWLASVGSIAVLEILE